MEYVLFKGTQVVGISKGTPYTGKPALKERFDDQGVKIDYDRAENSRSLKSCQQANEIAAALSTIYGETFIPADDGPGTSHRYGVITLPKLGEDVSCSFNGDSYPCGKITRITPSLRITATDDRGNTKVFNRYKQSGGWKMVGGTWWMVEGIHYERNPSF